jgi:septal ring factor EnvC (AmiA/AmiB activator)
MSGKEEHQCACGGSCGCQQETNEVYLTREEYIHELEKYMQRLQEEISSVEAELAKLRQVA